MGTTWHAASPARRPALQERLPVRRHLPGAGNRCGAGIALRRHRGDAASSRRNQPPRRQRSTRRAAARPRWMAHNRKAECAEEHHADPAAIACSRTQSCRERLAISARKLALQSRLRRLRRHHRRRLRGVAEARRPTRYDHINRNARLGPRRSIIMTVGISQAVREAMKVPDRDRHTRAVIITHSGSQYGWGAIGTLFGHVRVWER